MDKDFYTPREIKFTRAQCLWLIYHWVGIRDGQYPPEPSSYIDIPIGKKTISRKASFVTAAEFYIEISDRLEKCGIDGLILLAIECWGESVATLAKYFPMPEWSIRKRRNNALGYISSGPARRWLDTENRGKIYYQEWVKGKRWDAKEGVYYWKRKVR